MGIRRLVMVAVAVAVLATTGSPAAHAHGQGALSIEGTAHLPAFPCRLPGPCLGSFEGAAAGALGGVHEGAAWTAALQGAGVTAEFGGADLGCTHGIGGGIITVTASAGAAQVFGVYDDGGTFPLNILGITIEATYAMIRVGTVMVMTIGSGTIQLDLPGGGLVTVATGIVGSGASVWDASDVPTGSCFEPEGPPADVDLVSAIALAQAGVD